VEEAKRGLNVADGSRDGTDPYDGIEGNTTVVGVTRAERVIECGGSETDEGEGGSGSIVSSMMSTAEATEGAARIAWQMREE